MSAALRRVVLLAVVTGCAVHPAGESEERERAAREGEAFAREAPPLPENAELADVLRRAFVASPLLQQRWWEWKAAIERIPEEGSPKTTAAVSLGAMFEKGSTSRDMLTLGLGTDPMSNLPFPSKLTAAATQALEEARAVGRRFDQTKFDLQAKVLGAWYDWALLAEKARLATADRDLLTSIADAAEAKTRTGGAQHETLRARTELDLAANELQRIEAAIPSARARLNALLDRPADALLPPPPALPAARPIARDDADILALAAERSPELAAMTHDVRARETAVERAKLEYLPDFALSASTNLAGTVQSLMGMITAPLLRHEALQAGIARTRADLEAMRAARRQASRDLATRVVTDLQMLHDLDRQTALFEKSILPRAEITVESTRTAYTTGQTPLVDLLDAKRSLIELRRTLAEFRVEREKAFADLEAAAGATLEQGAASR